MSERSNVLTNLTWGLAYGLGVSVLFCAFVGVMALLRGSTAYEGGVSTWRIMLIYLATGGVGGLVAGLIRPLGRTRLGGTLMGAVLGTLVYAAVSIGLDGYEKFAVGEAVFLGVLVGGIVGFKMSKD